MSTDFGDKRMDWARYAAELSMQRAQVEFEQTDPPEVDDPRFCCSVCGEHTDAGCDGDACDLTAGCMGVLELLEPTPGCWCRDDCVC